MFAITELAPNGLVSAPTKTQAQLVASVIAQQRVIAAQAGAESGDAAARNFSGSGEREKAARTADRMKQRADAEGRRPPSSAGPADRASEAQSIVEAQEASMKDRKLVAAFHARHGITELLSVIRDPEDQLLPNAPEE